MKNVLYPLPIGTLGAVLLFTLVAGGGALQAQSTSPLDPALGAATSSPAASDSTAAPAATDNLVPNGNFSTATNDPGWPDGWGKGNGITWENEGGKHFLRLVSQEPGKILMAYKEVKIPAGVTSLVFSVRFRTEGVAPGEQNWMDARTIFHFLDSNRKPVSPDPRVIDFPAATADWTVVSEKITIPTGATTLVLMPSLFKVAGGTLDLAEISVASASP